MREILFPQVSSKVAKEKHNHSNFYNLVTKLIVMGRYIQIHVPAMWNLLCVQYLQFLDGPIASGPEELLTTCGTTAPQPFTSTGNVMTVVFHTDISATGRGFLLSWTAVDQAITTPGTTLTPPTTPGKGVYGTSL